MDCFIYGLTDPRTDEIHYIGQSSSGMRRPEWHGLPSVLKLAKTSPKTEWVKSLVAAGVQYGVVVLERVADRRELDATECRWIAHGRRLNWPLKNLTDGGDGRKGFIPSMEERARISQALTGHPVSEETRAKMSAALRGKRMPPRTEAHRAALSAAQIGKVVSTETRAKLRAARLGRKGPPCSPETRAKMSAAHKARFLAKQAAKAGAPPCRS
jgi:hypothetical protein